MILVLQITVIIQVLQVQQHQAVQQEVHSHVMHQIITIHMFQDVQQTTIIHLLLQH